MCSTQASAADYFDDHPACSFACVSPSMTPYPIHHSCHSFHLSTPLSSSVCSCPSLHLSPAPSTFSPSWLEASTGEGFSPPPPSSPLLSTPSRSSDLRPPPLLSFLMHFISSTSAQACPSSFLSAPISPPLGLSPSQKGLVLSLSCLPSSRLPPLALGLSLMGSHSSSQGLCQYIAGGGLEPCLIFCLCAPCLLTAPWTWLASLPPPRKSRPHHHQVGVKTCSMSAVRLWPALRQHTAQAARISRSQSRRC